MWYVIENLFVRFLIDFFWVLVLFNVELDVISFSLAISVCKGLLLFTVGILKVLSRMSISAQASMGEKQIDNTRVFRIVML